MSSSSSQEYEVKSILEHLFINGCYNYKIKWSGTGANGEDWSDDKYDEWQTEKELNNCLELLSEYKQLHGLDNDNSKKKRGNATNKKKGNRRQRKEKMQSSSDSEGQSDDDDERDYVLTKSRRARSSIDSNDDNNGKKKGKRRAYIVSDEEDDSNNINNSMLESTTGRRRTEAERLKSNNRKRSPEGNKEESESIGRSGKRKARSHIQKLQEPLPSSSANAQELTEESQDAPISSSVNSQLPAELQVKKEVESPEKELRSALTGPAAIWKFRKGIQGGMKLTAGRMREEAREKKWQNMQKRKKKVFPPILPTVGSDEEMPDLFGHLRMSHGDEKGEFSGSLRHLIKEEQESTGGHHTIKEEPREVSSPNKRVEFGEFGSQNEGVDSQALAEEEDDDISEDMQRGEFNDEDDDNESNEMREEIENNVKNGKEKETENNESGEDRNVMDEDDDGGRHNINEREQAMEMDQAQEENGDDEALAEDQTGRIHRFILNPNRPNGYQQGYKGIITSHIILRLNDSEDILFYKVIFEELSQSQYIRADVVKAYDEEGYDDYNPYIDNSSDDDDPEKMMEMRRLWGLDEVPI